MPSSVKTCLLAVMLVVTACSVRGFALKFADRVAISELDRWFDLTNEQYDTYRPIVKAEIERLKKERLPGLVVKLEAFSQAWARGPTPTDAEALLDEYDALRVELASSLGPVAARFLKSLSKEQVGRLKEELEESNEKMHETAKLTEEEFVKKRRKSTLESFEYWLGDVSKEQEAQFLELVPPDRAEFEIYRAERLHAQRSFVELVSSGLSEADIAAKIAAWTKEPWTMRGATPEQGARRRAKMLRVLSAIHALATPKQRRHAQDEIDDLIADLKAASR